MKNPTLLRQVVRTLRDQYDSPGLRAGLRRSCPSCLGYDVTVPLFEDEGAEYNYGAYFAPDIFAALAKDADWPSCCSDFACVPIERAIFPETKVSNEERILDAMIFEGKSGLNDIHRETGIYKVKVANLLNALVEQGVIRRDTSKKYHVA